MTPLWPLVGSWLLGAVFLALDGRKPGVAGAAAACLVTVLALDVALLVDMTRAAAPPFEVVTGSWPQGVGIRLRVDRVSLLFGAVCAAVLSAVMVHEARAAVRSRLLPALLLLLSAGLHGAFATADLFNFYVFFELSVVTSFALAAYGYGRAEVRGTFIYIAVNLLGSVVFLIGVAAAYHASGTLDLAHLASRARSDEPARLLLPAAMIYVALFVKVGLFPFHGWVPVLYSHARPAIAAAMSGALVNIGVYGLLRVGAAVLGAGPGEIAPVMLVLGAVTTLYGALVACRRDDPAEIAAYAAVMHAGYVVLALGVGGRHGAAAVLLAVIAGSIDKAAMFLSLDASWRARRAAALIAAISTAGLPVTAGFLAKLQLFRAALAAPAAWAAIVGVTVLAAATALILPAGMRLWRLVRDAGPGERTGAMSAALAAVSVAVGAAAEPAFRLAWDLSAEVAGGGA